MSRLILWLPNIVLYPNKWILVKNCKFSDTIPGRFSNLSVPLKITKNARKRTKMPKIPFWWAHIIKIVGNYVWNKFWDISGRKVLLKKNLLILFVPKCPKTFSRHDFPLFLWYEPIKTGFLGFLSVFGHFCWFLVVRTN